jgi:hypothetical protein
MWITIERILLAGLVLAIGVPLLGQGATYRPPRGEGGKPDLNGVWQVLNEANYDLEGHSARPAMALRPGPYGPVPAAQVLALGAVGAVPPSLGVVEGGEIPYKPEALKQKEENQANWLTRDPEIKCYLPGVPRATYMPQPFRILQSASQIFIAYQYAGAVRNINLKDPGPAPVDFWMGQSVGHWEGETLVVDTMNFTGQTAFRGSGANLHLTERFTRMDAETLLYEFTVDDPESFAKPWSAAIPSVRTSGPILEYACNEGNYGMTGLLSAARSEERKAAPVKSK